MGHDHEYHDSSENLRAAFFLNLGFTILEFIGGIYTNSVSILSDAIHDLGDSISLGLSWYLDKKSKQKGDKTFSFGYQRFSLLAALINGAVLLVGSVFILSETIPRLFHPEHPDAVGMMWIAILGIIVNSIAVLKLRKGKSINEEVVTWHLMEDVMGWGAVLVVSIVLQFWDIPILDPILSILILLIVLFNVVKNMKKTIHVFLQAVPSEIDVDALQARVSEIDKVLGAHHTHVWSLDGEHHVLTIHVVLDQIGGITEFISIKNEIKNVIRDLGIQYVTIEVEFEDEHCYMEDLDKD